MGFPAHPMATAPHLLPGKSLSSLWTGLPANLSSVGLQCNTPPSLPLPRKSPATQLQSTRTSHSALWSLVGRLTMQGVGQHAGHALHHHLVGGLQEGRGGSEPWQPLSLACVWNGHSWGAKSSYGAQLRSAAPTGGQSPSVAPLLPTSNSHPPGVLLGRGQAPKQLQAFWGSLRYPHWPSTSPLPCKHKDPTLSLFKDLSLPSPRASPSPIPAPTSFTTFFREVFMSSLLDTCSISSGGKT